MDNHALASPAPQVALDRMACHSGNPTTKAPGSNALGVSQAAGALKHATLRLKLHCGPERSSGKDGTAMQLRAVERATEPKFVRFSAID